VFRRKNIVIGFGIDPPRSLKPRAEDGMAAVQEPVDRVRRIDVDQNRYGSETGIESPKAPKGLSEDTIRFISAKKNEPVWMLEWRLEAYRRWLTMTEPKWARVNYPKIDYQDLYYYSAPKKKALASLDEVDPEVLKTYEKAGIPLREVEALEGVGRPEGERRIAVDAVFDSVSVATTFQKELKQAGVIFMPISEAIREHPDLVKKYLGTGVPTSDNFFPTLNPAVLSDGAVALFPHQRAQPRPVRAHADHRRQGRLRQLPRRLHRPAARREPAARRRGRTRHEHG